MKKKCKHIWKKSVKCVICLAHHLYCKECGEFKSKEEYVWLFGFKKD